MIVRFSTKANPLNHIELPNVSDFVVNEKETRFYIADESLEIMEGVFVVFDGGAKGLEVIIPHDDLEDLSWSIDN